MQSAEMKTLCDVMCAGNVSKFVDLVGITRAAYYRSLNADTVHELTAHKIQAKLHEMTAAVGRLDRIEARLEALEGKQQ